MKSSSRLEVLMWSSHPHLTTLNHLPQGHCEELVQAGSVDVVFSATSDHSEHLPQGHQTTAVWSSRRLVERRMIGSADDVLSTWRRTTAEFMYRSCRTRMPCCRREPPRVHGTFTENLHLGNGVNRKNNKTIGKHREVVEKPLYKCISEGLTHVAA